MHSERIDLRAATLAVRMARRGVPPAFEDGQLGDDQRDELVLTLPQWVAARKGWLYVARNDAWPSAYKVGCTRKGVPGRMKALSGTAVLTPWTPCLVWAVYDAPGLEAACHTACARWHAKAELFRVDLDSLQHAIVTTLQADRQCLLRHLESILLPGQLHDLLALSLAHQFPPDFPIPEQVKPN
ncbi:GIY-YIG nuclease family protein [Achromobacter xylosoxidans]|uniref:GIY-YIG nuclease family protein n=1 Tax=Achromobacter anxifer TaxID=1287737 RepID=UPI00158FDE6B|nr:GIY-YIG nuclease family protein [Achromobacter anxifer]